LLKFTFIDESVNTWEIRIAYLPAESLRVPRDGNPRRRYLRDVLFMRQKTWRHRIFTSIVSNPRVAETMSKACDFCGGSSDRGKSEIRRQAVEVCLLCLVEEVARVQDWMIGLWKICSVRKELWKKESNLHNNLDTVIRENSRRELGPSIGLPLVACVGGEESDGWRCAVHLFEEVRDEVGFVGVVESCNGEFELVCKLKTRMSDLGCEEMVKDRTLIIPSKSTAS
jgi:hypothetical protein